MIPTLYFGRCGLIKQTVEGYEAGFCIEPHILVKICKPCQDLDSFKNNPVLQLKHFEIAEV